MAIKNYSKREIHITELYTGEAQCEEIGDFLFFAEKEDDYRWTNMAKKICKTCPLILKCRDYALQNSVSGVWGGTTTKERQFIRTQLRIYPKPVMKGII